MINRQFRLRHVLAHVFCVCVKRFPSFPQPTGAVVLLSSKKKKIPCCDTRRVQAQTWSVPHRRTAKGVATEPQRAHMSCKRGPISRPKEVARCFRQAPRCIQRAARQPAAIPLNRPQLTRPAPPLPFLRETKKNGPPADGSSHGDAGRLAQMTFK